MTNEPANPKPPLRVGLLLDSLTQPRWVFKIINDLRASEFVQICLVVKNEAEDGPPRGRLQSYWKNRNFLLYALYNRVDARASLAEENAFDEVDIEELLGDVPVLGVTPIMKKFSDWFPDEAVQEIRSYDLDVVISHGFRILRGEALRIAKHGVWSYHHADNLVNRGGPSGFWEVLDEADISGAVLQVLSEDLDNGEVINRAWSRTVDRFSVKVSKNNLYWRASTFVIRKLKELHANGKVTSDTNVFRPYYNRLHKIPTNAELLPRLCKLTWAYAAQKARYSFFFNQWQLAYRFRNSPDDPNNSFYRFKYLVPPKDKFWADPFAVRFEERYFVFFEEYLYKDDKAHISFVELSKSGASEVTPVLKRDYHLSYPFMLHWNNRYLMIPETAGNKTIEVYAAERFPNEWKLETVLFEGIAARDATLFEVEGVWWMFVAIADTEFSDELHVYYSDSPLGPWKPHAKNPVKSDVRNSRPAGRPFYWKGDLYRPAQDSSQRYGYGMRINKVVRLTPSEFREEEVSRVLPQWRKDLRGTHTLNICDDLTVIDCLVHRRK
jgi:folate-dependent phosphoribosylglycinamide formyltransferase PurN